MVNVVTSYCADGWRATVLVSYIYIYIYKGTSDNPLVLYFFGCSDFRCRTMQYLLTVIGCCLKLCNIYVLWFKDRLTSYQFVTI